MPDGASDNNTYFNNIQKELFYACYKNHQIKIFLCDYNTDSTGAFPTKVLS